MSYCYPFQHERGTLLWETGVPDSVAEQKDGVTAPSGVIVWFRDKTLESLGVQPDPGVSSACQDLSWPHLC